MGIFCLVGGFILFIYSIVLFVKGNVVEGKEMLTTAIAAILVGGSWISLISKVNNLTEKIDRIDSNLMKINKIVEEIKENNNENE